MAPAELLEYSNSLTTQAEQYEKILLKLALNSRGSVSYTDIRMMSIKQTELLREEIEAIIKEEDKRRR